MFYRFAGVFACGLISACGLMLAGCSQGSLPGSKAAPFIGKWVATHPLPDSTIMVQKTFGFRAGGDGALSLVTNLSQSAEPFRWNRDGQAINVSYPAQSDHPAQTDHLTWSVSDDGAQLTLTGSSGPTVYQKTP